MRFVVDGIISPECSFPWLSTGVVGSGGNECILRKLTFLLLEVVC